MYDLGGILLAKTTDMNEVNNTLLDGFIESPADSQVIGNHHLLKVWDEGELLKTITYKIEPFNFYYKTEECELYPEAPLCKIYKDTSNISEKEFKEEWVFLPDELRVQFYLYFPEHGLNMANYSQELAYELARKREAQFANRFYFSHND